MNGLFIAFLINLIVTLLGLTALLYFTFINKQISGRDYRYLLFGMLGLVFIYLLFLRGSEVNEKLSIENIPTEIVSGDGVNDSIINDTILYRYLLDIRSKHPEIILIQSKIESNNYRSSLFLYNKNLLGMKVSGIRTSINNGQRAGYQKYTTWKQCINDYVLWGYTHNFDQLGENEYINLLQKIYAEDPNYGNKIRKMLNSIDFEKLKN
jgi:hypothetical protein